MCVGLNEMRQLVRTPRGPAKERTPVHLRLFVRECEEGDVCGVLLCISVV